MHHLPWDSIGSTQNGGEFGVLIIFDRGCTQKRPITKKSDAFLLQPYTRVAEVVQKKRPIEQKSDAFLLLQGKTENRKLPYSRLSICKTIHNGRVG